MITPFTVSAAVQGYTTALEDLKKDPKFDVNDYPSVSGSNEIQLIHIGEGVDGELYVYTYQPGNATKHYKAKYINMALQSVTDKNISYKLYSLTWLNSDGVFDKYVVNDFTITTQTYRYYTIAGIYRLYDKSVDSSSSSEAIDTVQCKSFPVGQTWCLYYYNDVLIYEAETMEYVDISVHATGTIRYYDGFSILFGTTLNKCDVHYVAFSVENFDIEKIYDADITYTVVPAEFRYVTSTASGTVVKDETKRQIVNKTLTEFDTGSNKGTGLFGKKYTWTRISTVSEFITEVESDSNDSFSDAEKTALNNSDFVFRFLETDYVQKSSYGIITTDYTIVENIGILRLHFLSKGKVYNLGCVGDLVGTDSTPELDVTIKDNVVNTIEEFEGYQKIMAVILLILLIVVFTNIIFPIARPLIKIFIKGFGFIIEALWNILTIPIRLIFDLKQK